MEQRERPPSSARESGIETTIVLTLPAMARTAENVHILVKCIQVLSNSKVIPETNPPPLSMLPISNNVGEHTFPRPTFLPNYTSVVAHPCHQMRLLFICHRFPSDVGMYCMYCKIDIKNSMRIICKSLRYSSFRELRVDE